MVLDRKKLVFSLLKIEKNIHIYIPCKVKCRYVKLNYIKKVLKLQMVYKRVLQGYNIIFR